MSSCRATYEDLHLTRNVAYITSTASGPSFPIGARDGCNETDYEDVILGSARVLTGLDPDEGYENPLQEAFVLKGQEKELESLPTGEEDPDQGYENPLSSFLSYRINKRSM